MRARRQARKLALDVLYEAEIKDILPTEALGALTPAHEAPTADITAYTAQLVNGVTAHAAAIDEIITSHADRWALDRMPVIDRNLLRMAIYELLFDDQVPVAVAINEAVELAKEYSTPDSGRFLNGLLGKVAEEAGR